jgi:hypothetical protein
MLISGRCVIQSCKEQAGFAKTYVKKKKDSDKADRSQLDIFQQETSRLNKDSQEDIS